MKIITKQQQNNNIIIIIIRINVFQRKSLKVIIASCDLSLVSIDRLRAHNVIANLYVSLSIYISHCQFIIYISHCQFISLTVNF